MYNDNVFDGFYSHPKDKKEMAELKTILHIVWDVFIVGIGLNILITKYGDLEGWISLIILIVLGILRVISFMYDIERKQLDNKLKKFEVSEKIPKK